MVGALPVCPDIWGIGVRLLIPFTSLTSAGNRLLGLGSKSQPASVDSGSKAVGFLELTGLLHSARSTGLLLGPRYSAGRTGLSPAGRPGPWCDVRGAWPWDRGSFSGPPGAGGFMFKQAGATHGGKCLLGPPSATGDDRKLLGQMVLNLIKFLISNSTH